MTLDSQSPPAGFRASDLLILPEFERQILQWLMRRRRASAREISDQFGQSLESIRNMLGELERRGFLSVEGEEEPRLYQPKFGFSRVSASTAVDLWKKLGDL